LKKIRLFFGLGLMMALLLSACESLPFELPWVPGETPTATLPPGENGDATPTPETTITADVTPEPVTEITLWVPPEMDPALDTDASRLFVNRLQLFSDLNNGLEINVRVKAVSGAGGLLDSLTATSAAAPDALPDLIALSRPDLENAALKGLIFPLDGLTEIPDDTDWYDFTREMALLQGSTFGIPFAADSLILVYRPTALPELPADWFEIIDSGTVLAFPAGSDQQLFPTALYLSAGGLVQDNQRRPTLELDPLTEVFRLIQEGTQSGTFPESLNQYQTSGQVWTAFRDGQSNLAVTWFSNYLKENLADVSLSPLLPMSESAVSFGTGMSWAVATPKENHHSIAVSLAEYLVEPEFLSEWTAAAGYLPTRPSALDGWQNQSLRTTVNQTAIMTKLVPANDIISSLGPLMREGTRQILQDLIDPVQAAQVAVESLGEQ
jgi:ABC-type glycerol-3-phosphate transport system substrate-binding protein